MKHKDHTLYHTWKEMRRRCSAKHRVDFKNYGGRGITVCKEWSDFKIFIKDIGPRPTKKHSLDRIDNDKGYSKKNCRWATRKEQVANRRISSECHKGHPWTKENTMLTNNGKGKTRRCKKCYLARVATKRVTP